MVRRRNEALPTELLNAAMEVFGEKGFAAARMEDIARRASVAKGTVYLYYPSKEAVFEALIRAAILPLLDSQRARLAQEGLTPPELLTRFLAAVPDLIRQPAVAIIPKLVIAEAANFPEIARLYKGEVVDKGLGLIAGILKRGIAEGYFRAVDPEITAKLVFAPVLLSIVWRTAFEDATGDRLDLEALIAAHIDLLRSGLHAKEAS